MTEIKLVAIDMDGTLLTSNDEITNYTKNILKRAQEAGIKVVISTGRGYARLKHMTAQLNLNEPIVASNGAEVLIDPNGQWSYEFLDEEVVRTIFKEIEQLQIPFWGFTDRTEFVNERITSEEMQKCLKIGVQTDDENLLKQFYDRVKNIENLEITQSSQTNYELNGKGISKALGLQKLCDFYDIKMAEIMCFGDSANDLKMFQAVGFPVAMENAIPQLKEIAKAMTKSNDEDGVAKAIEQFLLK